MTGVALLSAATLFALHPSIIQKGEIKPNILQDELPVSTSHDSEELVVTPAGQVPVTLVDTIDGDTIKVYLQGKIETIRYLLIDTPESKNPKMCVQPYALEAARRNDELVKSGTLTIEFEQGNSKDSYGRLLAYIYVDGQSVQETLLKEGYARVGYIMNPPYKYLSLYNSDESSAKKSHLNIWSKTDFVTKWGFYGCASG